MNIKTLTVTLLILIIIQSTHSQLNNWEYCGIDSACITAMYNFGNGHLITGTSGEAQPIYVSYDYGKNWDTLSMALPSDEIRRFEYFNNTLYACLIGNYPSIYMSQDSGKTWYTPDTINGQYEYPLAYTYCMEARDSIVIAGGFNKYARSTDYGDTWEKLYLCDFFDDLDENEVGAMLSMVQFRDTLYVGTQCGVFATKDWGLSWEKRGKNSSTASSGTVSSIDMLDSIILIGTNYGVYFSHNYGGTGVNDWELIFHNQSGVSELHNVKDSLLLFGNNYGSGTDLFYSADTGKTWNQFYLQQTTERIAIYGFLHDDKYFYALTNPGVWRYPRFENVTINNYKPKYAKLNKTRNFVKWSNKNITIQIVTEGFVKIDIYSLDGKMIHTLVESNLPQGTHILRINNLKKELANGIYLAKAVVNGEYFSQKVNWINKKM